MKKNYLILIMMLCLQSIWAQIQPPANDDPINAILLTVGDTCNAIIGSNVGATNSKDNDSTIPDPGCASYRGGDVWYQLEVPASGSLTLETYENDNSSITNGGLAIYRMHNGNLVLLDCRDNTGTITEKYFERIQVYSRMPGEILYVRVWSSYNTTSGTFNICARKAIAPVNNNPENAIEITVGDTCNPTLGSNVDATPSEYYDESIPDPECSYYEGGDVWYKLVVPASGNLIIETYEDDDLSITNGGLAVYSGSYGGFNSSLELIECKDGNGTITEEYFERIQVANRTPGEILYVRFWTFRDGGRGTFNICARTAIAPANDNPENAIELSVGNSCNAIIGSNVDASASESYDESIEEPTCDTYEGGDVWYKVVVPATGTLAIETYEDEDLSITDGGLAIYSGPYNALELMDCDYDSGDITDEDFERILLKDLTPGETLYVRFWSGGDNKRGTFNICATIFNDDPISAIELSVGNTCNAIIGSNDGSTASEEYDSSIPDPGCARYSGRDVWYKVVAPASGKLAIETFEEADRDIRDGGLAVYSGPYNALELIECDNDSGVITNEDFERIELNDRTPGETLYVRFWAYDDDDRGRFNICATTLNDDPISATPLIVGESCNAILGSNVDATNSEDYDESIPDPDCASYDGGDVWYTVEVPESGYFIIETYEDEDNKDDNGDFSIEDGGLAIYSGTYDNLVLLNCDDDSGEITDEDFEEIRVYGRTPGEILYVRFWTYDDDSRGTFNICARSVIDPINDDPFLATELIVGDTCNAIIGSNVGATDSEDYDENIPDPECGTYSGYDVWYKVKVPASGSLAIETYEDEDLSITNGGLAVYSGSYDNLELIECNDGDGEITNQDFEKIDLYDRTPGEILYVRFWTFENDSRGTFNICATINDEVPIAVCKNMTAQLDATGSVTILATDVDNGSSDDSGSVTLSIDTDTFNCSNIGANAVTLTVTDPAGNTDTCVAIVTVEDTIKPTVVTQNIIVQLDENGVASITPNQINNASTDNCGIESYALDIDSFDCSNVGENEVVLTVTDVNGNRNTATAIVTVEDNSAPTVVTQNIIVQLNENGDVTITPEQINNGSNDNCSIASTLLDITSFDCSNVGDNTVTLTVTDTSGNEATATAVVRVENNNAPIVITQNISVALDSNGNASITTDDIDEESIDVCGIASISLDRTNFDCATLGDYTVTLTVTNTAGISASETATVTVTADDIDGDLIADVCDDDMDGDGILNNEDSDINGDGINDNGEDTDGDGINDENDDDMDGDGVANAIDNCPTVSNPDQADIDRNGVGDVCDQGDLEIPKGFSPNGDGVNDEFVIAGLQVYPNNSIEIYNRYGNMVYESRNYQNYWDGVSTGKTQKLPAAPYFYVLMINGGSKIVKGWVYINY